MGPCLGFLRLSEAKPSAAPRQPQAATAVSDVPARDPYGQKVHSVPSPLREFMGPFAYVVKYVQGYVLVYMWRHAISATPGSLGIVWTRGMFQCVPLITSACSQSEAHAGAYSAHVCTCLQTCAHTRNFDVTFAPLAP